jgi:hypothetical protein
MTPGLLASDAERREWAGLYERAHASDCSQCKRLVRMIYVIGASAVALAVIAIVGWAR